MAEDKDKTIDEAWKKHIQEEKEKEPEEEGPTFPEASFILFVSSLATQALMALGEIENPVTRGKEKNLAQAKFTIDTLSIIQEKTRGNLTPEEKRYLEDVLHDLKMSYISST